MGLIASKQGLEIVERARRKKRWNKYAPFWYESAYVCRGTLQRFWKQTSIQADNFQNICQAVGVNWEEIVDREASTDTSLGSEARFFSDEGSQARLHPFGDKGCIRDPRRFFDRRELLEQLFEGLARGCSQSIVGESEIGKSSVLWAICSKGPQRLQLPDKAFIMLGMECIYDEQEFWDTLCEQVGIKDRRDFMRKTKLQNRRYILCLDEIEAFTDEKRFPPHVLSFLRGVADGDRTPLTLVIASRSPLQKLFPDLPERTSPLANICKQHRVGVFPPEIAREFLHSRLRDTNVTFSEDQIASLLAESGCHPAKLQERAAQLYDRLVQE
ncbi:ATP-binding protein [Oscillatoriales cyanobacterium LEGE 11467]|uniref:ATP-binding protein n=1 Tax=Zarconia navalis LEGE 11467 TaxID=1828826 RepID=A0A928VT75_9CYAN|nr:ATP-binding protein [Zarconia navalis]MBE9039711.1 ATP-binding protein [Zarconia navalis LEGE 11467]